MFYKLLTCLNEKNSLGDWFELYLMLPTEERLTKIGMIYQRYYHLHEGFNKEEAEQQTQVESESVPAQA
ncbi:hypothetical protein [Vibrio rotiferianus]|uniref:hypothetical protein n=1 Tax=Vibrio rotiferianus TaxID=190895 RepID=UPI00057805B6|nr:hypothetical protein [Vibrio rotiferianus]PIB16776.1 hypothetical protein B853_09302 [Vibrio rotiferianus CAIM 577 = LMG 21460]